MTFVVAFDGSELPEAALVRAAAFSAVLDGRVVAVSVVPRANVEYARERGWLDPGEGLDMESVVHSAGGRRSWRPGSSSATSRSTGTHPPERSQTGCARPQGG